MKHSVRLTLCTVLALLLVLSAFCSCGTGSQPDAATTSGGGEATGPADPSVSGTAETEGETTGTEPGTETGTETGTSGEAPLLSVVSGGSSRYQLIYTQDTPTATVMSAFLKLVNSATGCLLDFAEDTDQPASDDSYEILIGDTNRPESQRAKAELQSGEYLMCVDGRKIVLIGSDTYSLSLAVTEFYTAALKGTSLSVCSDYRQKGKVSWGNAEYPIAVTEQKNTEIVVYDLAKGGLTEDNVIRRFPTQGFGAADTRLRELNGKRVVLAAGGFHAFLYDYETGETLWSYVGNLIWNAHAMELLPNGVIAVAGSTGNNLTFFDSADPANTSPLRLEFEDAHGAVWDPTHEVLWVCGKNVMKSYRVTLTGGTIHATEQQSLTIPESGAHDLQPVYGTPGSYWVTTSSGVYVFDSNTGRFSAIPASARLGLKAVKGIGSFPDGCIVQTIADGSYESWNTATVHFYRYNETLKIYIMTDFVSPTDAAFYKVRAWFASYS